LLLLGGLGSESVQSVSNMRSPPPPTIPTNSMLFDVGWRSWATRVAIIAGVWRGRGGKALKPLLESSWEDDVSTSYDIESFA
jgi:hypothetical protein